MHELSICQNLVNQVSDVAKQHRATGVKQIYLTVGSLSGIEPQLLQQSFPFASADTIVDGAKLNITLEPLEVICQQCHKKSKVSMQDLTCHHCHSWETKLLRGDELTLTRVELQLEEDN